MPNTPRFPGVYVEEVSSGVRTITGVATSVAAFIGRARKGPVDEPVEITSFRDFERCFGGLWLDATLGFAVRDFFLNGGAKAVVVRVFGGAVADATRRLRAGSLTFQAASPGQWGGWLRIEVSAARNAGAGSAGGFDLTVTDGVPGGSSETYVNLGLAGPRRVDRILAAESMLIRWDGDLDSAPVALPAFDLVTGDAVGAAYAAWVGARRGNPDPAAPAVVSARQAFDDAQAVAMQSVGDGDPLSASDVIGDATGQRGLHALEKLSATDGLFNLLCIPPYTAAGDVDAGVVTAAAAYCEQRRAMLIVDPPAAWVGPQAVEMARAAFSADPDAIGTRSHNAALFFPRLQMPNPLRGGQLETFAPCGAIAGVFARIDTQRGVWKSPAGMDARLAGVSALSVPMSDAENGLLNPLGINCLRCFPSDGPVVWGARTLRGADSFADEYKYIAVRRTALYIEESLCRGLRWAAFEPNDEPLWAQVRLNVGAFMHSMFRQGAFQGAAPRDAYFVRCDAATTTQDDINLGMVNIEVGFAPLKPAEFVMIRLQQAAGKTDA